ncbi:unnamed protein product [Didymodactylos carnosus]|uniref:Small ribosomal subunit protein uS7 domain-containing protein n=1 Tax=Didymodactylos carnosus TaxID=1234261 RepID=A0A8S2UP48_9BILA|nr:unnamed protein product [Didymodactylos carnosus]CAF4343881.1 unnamed protein product [Didymodactylos carnosus]
MLVYSCQLSLKPCLSKSVISRSFHLTINHLTASQTGYHGQPNSTWWDKYALHKSPIMSREELLTIDDLDERHFKPVLPVIPTYQSYSCFHDPTTSRLIGMLMRNGNRELTEELIRKTFRVIKLINVGKYNRAQTKDEQLEIECNPVKTLQKAIKNVTPVIRLTKVSKGGTLYTIPVPMKEIRGIWTAIKLLIETTNDARPHDQRFWTLFAKELMDAADGKGRTIKKKQEIHRNAELNRAYAHFKWTK